MSKTATPGFCPYCKTALNPGATACAGCSAFETTGWDELGVWKNSLLGLAIAIPIFIAPFVFLLSPIMGLIFFFGPILGYIFIRVVSKRKIVWAVGGRRPV